MRLKVENIKLRDTISEATYADAFSQIKKGDVLTIKTGKRIYKAEIIYKFANQISFEFEGQYYMLTDNSFRGNTLETRRLIVGDDGRTKGSVQGPTITGIYNITVTRNGKPVSGVTPEKGRTEPEAKKQAKQKDVSRDRYEDISNELKSFNEDDRMLITTGKLITKGRDRGSLARNTVTEITLEVVKKTKGGMLKTKMLSVEGAEASQYDYLKNQYIFIGSESIILTNEGITLLIKTVSSGQPTKSYIKNVFSISNEGVDIGDTTDKVTDKDIWDVIQSSPHLRKRVYQTPSLLGKLFGKDPKYDPQALDLMFRAASDLGKYKKGDKVQFTYYGNPIKVAKDIDLERGGDYVGRFDGKDTIIIKSTNRKDVLEIKLVGVKGDKKVAQVTHKSTRFNRSTEDDLGKAIVTLS